MKLPEKWQKVVEQNTEYIVHFSVKIKKNVFFFFLLEEEEEGTFWPTQYYFLIDLFSR